MQCITFNRKKKLFYQNIGISNNESRRGKNSDSRWSYQYEAIYLDVKAWTRLILSMRKSESGWD